MTPALPLLLAALAGTGPSAELMAVDAAWDATVGARDEAAFLSRVAANAVFAGPTLQVGRKAIRKTWSRYFVDGGPTLRWTPTDSGSAASGDLGWTIGDSMFAWKAKGIEESPGRYVTVWVKDRGGRWVALLDSSLEPAAPGRSARKAVRTVISRDGRMEASIGTWERGGGPARKGGTFLTVRKKLGGDWHTVVDSEVEVPPSR